MVRRGRRSGTAVCAVVLCVVAALPAGARASHPADGCSKSWHTNSAVKDCGFKFQGFPIAVYGKADRNAGQLADVRVWVTVSTYESLTLVECAEARLGVAECTGDLSAGGPLGLITGVDALTCRVAGKSNKGGEGVFACSSGDRTACEPNELICIGKDLPTGVP
ncbi:MAG TPA: hypothetical protein VGB83_06335 [Actinomycetota bacterium]